MFLKSIISLDQQALSFVLISSSTTLKTKQNPFNNKIFPSPGFLSDLSTLRLKKTPLCLTKIHFSFLNSSFTFSFIYSTLIQRPIPSREKYNTVAVDLLYICCFPFTRSLFTQKSVNQTHQSTIRSFTKRKTKS